jgi:hypothetical protein
MPRTAPDFKVVGARRLRSVYAASSVRRLQTIRFTLIIRTLKRA